jgi:spore coat protein JB
MTEREKQVKTLSCLAFSMYELRLFLDTHPDSEPAMKKLKELETKYLPMRKKFEEKFGPLKSADAENAIDWIKSPWPWEVN